MSKGLVLAVMLSLVVTAAWAQSPNDLVRQADLARRPGDSFVWTVKITSYEHDKAPKVNEYEVYVKRPFRTFVRFVSPAREVGKSLLALDRDLWIYLPDAGKPVRIPFAQRLVGQVSNGDVARTDYAGDYTATLLGTETLDAVVCYVLDLKAVSKEVTYFGIKYWVAKDESRPIKAEFYAGTGTLLKTGTFEEYREINGRPIATRLTLVDGIRKDRKSVLDFNEVKVRDLPEKYFSKNYMRSLD